MNINRIFSFGLLVMTAAAGAAQAEQQATFHLPFEARWGLVTLAPGDYKVLLPGSAPGISQFIVDRDHHSRFVQPLITDYDQGENPGSSRSYLQLVNVDGTYFVSKYRSGMTGKTFTFRVPKPKHQLRMTARDVVNVETSSE
jgi:hypothetical protein